MSDITHDGSSPAKGQTGSARERTPDDTDDSLQDTLRDYWGWLMALGALLIVGGFAAFLVPLAASVAVEILVAVAFAAAGICQAIHAVRATGWRARSWAIVSALIYIAGATVLILNPLAGLITLTAFMIAVIGVDSAVRVVMAFRMRPDRGWGWVLTGGIAGLLLTGLMIALLPGIGLTLLGLLAGVALTFEGVGFVMTALALRRGDGDERGGGDAHGGEAAAT